MSKEPEKIARVGQLQILQEGGSKMKEIKEYFESKVVMSFDITKRTTAKDEQGRYISPTIEDHWQTFQEGVEYGIRYTLQAVTANKDS